MNDNIIIEAINYIFGLAAICIITYLVVGVGGSYLLKLYARWKYRDILEAYKKYKEEEGK